jgi:apolipoprotein N-acyltransferase
MRLDPAERAAAPEMAAGHDPRLLATRARPDRGAPDPELGAPDLVIWPETSLPVLLDRSDASRVQLSVAAGDAPMC